MNTPNPTPGFCVFCKAKLPEFGVKSVVRRYCNETCRDKQRELNYQVKYPLRPKWKTVENFTIETYNEAFEKQQGKCAICPATEPGGKKKRWCVDHDHKTGKFRGLLCWNCNVGLGNFKDSIASLQKAIEYLSS